MSNDMPQTVASPTTKGDHAIAIVCVFVCLSGCESGSRMSHAVAHTTITVSVILHEEVCKVYDGVPLEIGYRCKESKN